MELFPSENIEDHSVRRVRRRLAACAVSIAVHGFLLFIASQEKRVPVAPSSRPIVIKLLPALVASAGSPSPSVAGPSDGQTRLVERQEQSRFSSPSLKPQPQVVKRIAPEKPRPSRVASLSLQKELRQPAAESTPATPEATPTEPTGAVSQSPAATPGRATSSEAETGEVDSESRTFAREDTARNGYGGEGDTPLPVSAVAHPPMLVHQVKAEYPPRARRIGIEGLVRLKAILDREGRIEHEIQVLESVQLLDEAAVNSVRQWRFTPARNHAGQTVRVFLEIPIQFVLRW